MIEQGITEISKLCFYGFTQLSEVYIPNSIALVGEKAFNPKTSTKFNMPSTIHESDLLAGNVIYTKAVVPTYSDPIAGIDLSNYGDDSAAGKDEVSSVKPSAPKITSITPGTADSRNVQLTLCSSTSSSTDRTCSNVEDRTCNGNAAETRQ